MKEVISNQHFSLSEKETQRLYSPNVQGLIKWCGFYFATLHVL
jgi:hypothetical protein